MIKNFKLKIVHKKIAGKKYRIFDKDEKGDESGR